MPGQEKAWSQLLSRHLAVLDSRSQHRLPKTTEDCEICFLGKELTPGARNTALLPVFRGWGPSRVCLNLLLSSSACASRFFSLLFYLGCRAKLS